MNPLRYLRARFRLLALDERGIALPVALFAMVSSMALAGAAVMATVDVQRGAQRDNSSKDAIAAADAGANVARARMSRYAYVLSTTTPCLKVGVGGKLEGSSAETVGGASWCPAITGTVGGSTYSYRVSPVGVSCGEYNLCVVSTGTAGVVSRRIEMTYNQSSLVSTPSGGSIDGLVGKNGVTMVGNAEARLNVGTNGYLVTTGNASICGNVRTGIGKPWSGKPNCNGKKTEGNINLPPVSSFIPSNIATNNSNNRITACTATNVPVECQKDSYSGSWSKKPPFNPTTRALSLSGKETLTVSGGDYWICSLQLSGNSQLIMAATAQVRFFFDTPEHCGTSTQISLTGNSRITATGYQPQLGDFNVPGFYLLGSTTSTSQVKLAGNQSIINEAIVYGTETLVEISGNATWKGVFVGKEISMSGNGKVEQDAGFKPPPELVPTAQARYFAPQSYYECNGGAATGAQSPNTNC